MAAERRDSEQSEDQSAWMRWQKSLACDVGCVLMNERRTLLPFARFNAATHLLTEGIDHGEFL